LLLDLISFLSTFLSSTKQFKLLKKIIPLEFNIDFYIQSNQDYYGQNFRKKIHLDGKPENRSPAE
jgi:hypothetical protein